MFLAASCTPLLTTSYHTAAGSVCQTFGEIVSILSCNQNSMSKIRDHVCRRFIACMPPTRKPTENQWRIDHQIFFTNL